MGDERVCPICQRIDGHTWTFTDEVPNSLTHPSVGEVWNTAVGSQAHGHQGFNCRCRIEPHFSLHDLAEKIRILHDEIQAAYIEGGIKSV